MNPRVRRLLEIAALVGAVLLVALIVFGVRL
jgi:hypothetical protein